MLQFEKEAALTERQIPFGVVEVWYPERSKLQVEAFRRLVGDELPMLRQKIMTEIL